VPSDVADSLVNEKLAKQSKIDNNKNKPDKGEDIE
tara:strand:+ start:695 stop:799 length:105 start_codon:yes stop_codon:yes gene_type:complete